MNWITIKEKLPEKNGSYLTLVNKRFPNVKTFYNGKFYNHMLWIVENQYDEFDLDKKSMKLISHWSPLPTFKDKEQ